MAFELYISRASPYSIKVQALMGYTGIDHQVKIQNGFNRYAVIRRLTGDTMVPVLRKGGWAMNDSTEIARFVMKQSGRPTLPGEAGGATLAWLLEDFADEWLSRAVMQSRWAHRQDSEAVARVIGEELLGPIPIGHQLVGEQVAALIQRRLVTWGVRGENEDALQHSLVRILNALEAVLGSGPRYLFDAYPTIADFSFYGALGQYFRDPTGRHVLEEYPGVRAYLGRLEAYTEGGAFEEVRTRQRRSLEDLQALFGEVLGTYWPMLAKNLRGMEAKKVPKESTVQLLDGALFTFQPGRYMQNCLEDWLRLVNEAYQKRDSLFGDSGIRMERALIGRVAELSEWEGGRELLRQYSHLGLH